MIQRYGVLEGYDLTSWRSDDGNMVLYADHEAAMQEKDAVYAGLRNMCGLKENESLATFIDLLLNERDDLLKKLERSNDAWIQAKGEIANLVEWKMVAIDHLWKSETEITDLRAKLAGAEKAIEKVRAECDTCTFRLEREFLHTKLAEANEALREAIKHSIANEGTEDEFYRCYTYPFGLMPEWIDLARKALKEADHADK